MKKTIATIALLATIGLTVPFAVFAGWGGDGPGNCRMNNSGTTTESKEAVEARKKFFVETAELRKGVAVKQVELSTLLNSDNADQKAVKTLQGELIDLRAQLEKKAMETGFEGRGNGGCGMMGDGCGMMNGGGCGPGGSRHCAKN